LAKAKLDKFIRKASARASATVMQVQQDRAIRTTLYLLLGVLSLGFISALIGYLFGHESLKGVTQPDMNPFVGASASQGQYPRQGTFLLKEDDILANVQKQTKGIAKANELKKQADKAADEKEKDKTAKTSPSPKAGKVISTKLPLTTQSQGVTLQIRALKAEEGNIILDVTLQNSGSKSVQFLYDFLDVSDNQSQFWSTEVSGLPTQLPAKSETYSGAIKISGLAPDSAQWISLSLADYPDQKVELELPKILLKPSP
jgi:hypothetical protein